MEKLHRTFKLLTALVLATPVGACARDKTPTEIPTFYRAQAEGEAAVEVLDYEVRYSFAEDGTYTRTTRQRYKILTRAGVEGWGETSASWSAWYQQRPEIKAVVTTPAGEAVSLDPTTISVSAAYPSVPDIYSDAQVLRAPLPALSVGAVVDETITTRTTQPFFEGGMSFRELVQVNVPRNAFELSIELPEKMSLQHEVRGLEVEVADSTANGRRTMRFSASNLAALDYGEPSLPIDTPYWPEIQFSTGTSWAPISKGYKSVVEAQLSRFEIDAVPREIARSGLSREQKIQSLLDWLHSRVRYTGIELGDAAIIPHPPRDTLSRGYGDCKDQATFMVGLLREAGIKAHVALLRAGFRDDVRPELPGLNGFNHAIVYVPGKEPTWIDPTSEFVRAGELPVADQGRWALVADGRSKALISTPRSTADDNQYHEIRRIELSEYGLATTTEITAARGSMESGIRYEMDDSDANIKKSLESYVEETLLAEDLESFERTVSRDLSVPYHLELVAAKSELGETLLDEAEVAVRWSVLFQWLPPGMFGDEPRKSDLRVTTPFDVTVEHDIAMPAGFVLAHEPEFGAVELGPVKLVRRLEKRSDREIAVVYNLRLEKRRLTPADVQAFRDGIDALNAEPSLSLDLKHAGALAMDESRFVEGHALYESAMAREPTSAFARMRYAEAMRRMHFGELARKHAKAAVDLAPDNADVHLLFGDMLLADEYGVEFGPGFERDGAIQAYTRAAELGGEDYQYVYVHAGTVAEYDREGVQFGYGANLERAVELYEKAGDKVLRDYQEGAYLSNALVDLVMLGRHDEFKRWTRTLSAEQVPSVLSVAVAASERGTVGALETLNKVHETGVERAAVAEEAAGMLLYSRSYPEASALLNAAAELGGEGAERNRVRARMFGELRKVKHEVGAVDNPADAVTHVFALAFLHGGLTEKDASEALSSRTWVDERALDETRRRKALRPGKSNKVAAVFDNGFDHDMRMRPSLADLGVERASSKVEGSDAVGYRVRTTLDYGLKSVNVVSFVVVENGEYRIRAFAEVSSELGREALHLLSKGKEKAAAQWLAWAVELFKKQDLHPLNQRPFIRLWRDGDGDLELTAAALAAAGGSAPEAFETLERAAARERDEGRRGALDHAVVRLGLLYDRGDAVESSLARVEAANPHSRWVTDRKIDLYRKTGQWRKLVELVDDLARQNPDDVRYRALQVFASEWSGQLDRAHALGVSFIDTGRADADFYSSQAWRTLFLGNADEQSLEWALRGSNDDAARHLHTLASVYLALGRTDDAIGILGKLLKINGELFSDDRYVVGGIAQALGMTDHARQEYERVRAPRRPWRTSTYELTKKRLADL